MGWAKSLPASCAGTETVADLANATLATNMQSLDIPHRFDAISETAPVLVPVVKTVNKNLSRHTLQKRFPNAAVAVTLLFKTTKQY